MLILTFLCLKKNVSPESHICTRGQSKQTEAQFILDNVVRSTVFEAPSAAAVVDNLHNQIKLDLFCLFSLEPFIYKRLRKTELQMGSFPLGFQDNCVKSDLLNSRFVTLEVHEGKSLEV